MLSTPQQLLKFAYKTLLLSLLALLGYAAVAASVVRALTSVLAQQKTLIEKVASVALEQPVRIGAISAGWDGPASSIELQQVTIGTDSATQQALKFSSCAFDISVLNILLTGHVQIEKIEIIGTQFFVHQLADNSFLINGLWTYQLSPTKNIWWLPENLPITLQNIAFSWYGKNNAAPFTAYVGLVNAVLHPATPWRVDAQWQNLSTIRAGKIPGITTLDGEIEFTANHGVADIVDKTSLLDFGPLFRAPIFLNSLRGRIEWQRDEDDWIIKATHLLARNNDGIVTGSVSLLFPKDGSSPTINLLAATHVRSAKNIGNYLPLTVLRPTLVLWLEHSILSTSDAQGTIVLHGKLADFPFDNGTGTFIIDNRVKGVELRFWPEWPIIHDIDADLIFTGRRMDIHAYSARIINTPIQNINAYIPLLKKGTDATLYINGNINGNFADGVEFLRQSPLQGDFLNNLKNFNGTGLMQLQLQLALPLDHTEKNPPTVDGQLTLLNDSIQIPQGHLTLNNLQGHLRFTRDSVVTLNNLTATLWDKPLTITIQSDAQINFTYNNIAAALTSQKNNWSLQLQNPNLQGQIIISKNKQQPLQANFSRLYLTADTLQGSKQHWLPQDLPAINFNCNDVRYGDKKFGQVQLQLRPINNGTNIVLLQASAAAFTIKASGNWLHTNDGDQTQLRGALTSPAIGDALASWGLPASVTAKQSTIGFNLNWSSAAYDPSLQALNGQINLDIQQGEFTDVSSSTAVKIGIGRILNLLSIKSLVNDLKLNFGDLKSAGFTFDKLKGNFTLRNGDAFTKNTSIKATVADVDMTGRVGLVTKDYDLQIAVNPHMTASLPVIIGIAGGPIAGAITWAADKLLTPAVRTITSNNYHVTGPWANPVVTKISPQKNNNL
jgi:uncharacterized protein YhdP